MDTYCRKFVTDIFDKHDSDKSGVLERRELKVWVREEIKGHRYMNKTLVQKEFDEFFNKVDINNDGKIDRWELYTYCMHNMRPE